MTTCPTCGFDPRSLPVTGATVADIFDLRVEDDGEVIQEILFIEVETRSICPSRPIMTAPTNWLDANKTEGENEQC